MDNFTMREGKKMKFEIKHRISGSVLFSLECESLKVCVVAAVEKKANLSGADLSRAYLSGAYLSGADLSGANHVFHLGYPDGWVAFAWIKDGAVRVQVGCHDFTLTEGRKYWKDKNNRREILAALDYAERVADLRGWINAKAKKAA